MFSLSPKNRLFSVPLNAQGQSGFTLMEVMTVVVIVTILAMVAYPSLSGYAQRGKIPEATSTLSQLRSQLELYYQDYHSYGATSSSCGSSTQPVPSSSTMGSQYFTYTCTQTSGGDAQTYILTATGTGSMAGYKFTIDYQNNKKTLLYAGTDYSSSPKTCWLLKSTDC